MSKPTECINAAAFISISVLLAACGGGGGGGGGGVTTSSAPVTISATNAEEVAAASYKTTAGLEGGGGGVADSLPLGAVIQTASANIDPVDVLLSQIKTAHQRVSANATTTLTGVAVTETMTCPTSGSMSMTVDDADNNQQLSTGDSVSFSASNCVDDGSTMNGSVSVNIVTVDGDPDIAFSPYSMQFTLQANNFTITEGAESVALNGGMTMSESTIDGIVFSHSISGSSIQVTEGGVDAGLSNFSIAATEDAPAYTLDLNATVSSSELGGSVTIVTDTVFEGINPDEPSSGQATITGADNSSVTLIAMPANTVRLEIDEDGNGTAETFIDTTWDAL